VEKKKWQESSTRRSDLIPTLSCESIIRRICGSQWKSLPSQEQDAAWGIAIISAVLDGIKPVLPVIAKYLKVPKYLLFNAHRKLSMNGVFLREKIEADRVALNNYDELVWGYYGGIASGATGNVIVR